jgi:serine/threonine-protein kinase HipA
MKGNIVRVELWGQNVGLLSWDDVRGCATFQFDRDFPQSNLDIAPLIAPLDSPYMQKSFPLVGNKDKLYAGLPEFIADSLPDHWGNVVFLKWSEANHLSAKQINAVDRLSFIGRRAMGALEFQPAHITEDPSVDIELSSLYDLANRIFAERQDISIELGSNLILEDLYKVGTSAGGQRPKAIIAMDENTGTVRSGQAELPSDFTYYILKFDTGTPNDFPFTRVEMAYYRMATDAGIVMMPSQLVDICGRQNFLTRRFDRVGGKKVHTQTLAAMSSLADTYEDLFTVGRKIRLTAAEQAQQFRRMVFNIVAENVDDHTKNFSFIMNSDGAWHLSPAYDLLFSADVNTNFYRNHELSIQGKHSNITMKDLLTFAQRQDIRNAANIIDEVCRVVVQFRNYAEAVGINEYWTGKIEKVLQENEILKDYWQSK